MAARIETLQTVLHKYIYIHIYTHLCTQEGNAGTERDWEGRAEDVRYTQRIHRQCDEYCWQRSSNG